MMDRKPRAEGGPYIGRPMPRFEDLRLVRGAGRYSDDISMPGQAYRGVRALAARARAASSASTPPPREAMPGVIAVLTGADYVADGLKGAMQRANPAGAIDIKLRAFAPEKRPVLEEPQYPLAVDRVRYPGEAVAVVVAESAVRRARRRRSGRGRIRGAAGGDRRARGRSAPSRSGRRRPDNVALDQEFGDAAAVRAAFDAADLVVEQTFVNQRIANCQMEPRSGVASYDAAADSYTLISGNQGVHAPRMVLAESFGLPLEKIRFVCPDVGGGFGLRNNLYPEQATILWAAKRVGRPVKWTNDRSESFLTDYAGRDLVTTARLALDQRRPHHRLSRRSHRHLRRADRDLRAAEQRLSRRHHGLRHPADAHALPLGDDQHGADRAVPRRRPARGDAGAGAADRSRRRQARHRPACASARRTSSRRRSCPTAPRAGCSTTAATSPAT